MPTQFFNPATGQVETRYATPAANQAAGVATWGTASAPVTNSGPVTWTGAPVGSNSPTPHYTMSSSIPTGTQSTAFTPWNGGALAPTAPAATPTPAWPQQPASTGAPGVLTTPGAYEQWYAQNGGQYTNKQTQADQYWQGLQGRYGSAGLQPTNSSIAYTQLAGAYNQPSAGATNARAVGSQLLSPSQGEGYLSQAAGYFQGPNMTSNYASSLDPRAFNTAGASENFYRTAAPQLTGRGAGETNAYGLTTALQAPGAAEQNNPMVQKMLLGNNLTSTFANSALSNGLAQRNTVGTELNYFRPELRQNSYSEDLYESGNEGLNTFYDREYDKRQRRLEDQMAAMGVFGSGATARSMFELEGELGAAQARDMAGLANQADQARLGRVGAAQSFAQAAGQEEVARYGLGLDAARSADESVRGNAAGLTSAATAAQNAQLDRIFKSGTLGLSADEAGRARLQLAGDLAKNSDTAMLDRLKTGADIYDLADKSRFAQGAGLSDVGDRLAGQSLDRLRTSGDLGLRADQEERARLDSMFASANNLDSSTLAMEGFNRDTARNLDSDYFSRLDRQGAAALNAQTMFENRERYPLQDQMQLAQSMSSMVERAKTASADEQSRIAEQMIQTLIAQAGLSRQVAEQQVQQMYQSMGIALQGLAAIKK